MDTARSMCRCFRSTFSGTEQLEGSNRQLCESNDFLANAVKRNPDIQLVFCSTFQPRHQTGLLKNWNGWSTTITKDDNQ